MNYIKFQSKKVTKSNLIIIIVGILIILSFAILFMNKNALTKLSLESEAYGNLTLQKKNLKESESDIKTLSKNSERYRLTLENISSLKLEVSKTTKLIQALKDKNWKKVYEIKYSNLAKADKYTLEDSSATKSEKFYLFKNLSLFAYLKKHPMPYQEDPPSVGTSFIIDLNELYLPILFTLVAVFVLTQLYTSAYKNKLDVDSLIPLSNYKKTFLNTLTGIVLIVGIYLLVNLLAFVGSSLIFGAGNLNYPFYLFTSDHSGYYTQIKNIFIPALLLSFLSNCFIVLMMQLIAKIFKSQLPTLFVGILVLLGMNLATTVIVPLNKIAPYLPTTYFNSVKTVSNQLAFEIGNFNVNYMNGLLSTIVGIVIISIILHVSNLKLKSESTLLN